MKTFRATSNTPIRTLVGYEQPDMGPMKHILAIEADDVGDEYHTMSELYEHRMALNAFLFRMMFKLDEQVRGQNAHYEPLICKAKKHNDGTMFEGYFIVASNTAVGQISYHYDLKYWDKFQIPECSRVPWEYDGHTPQDCVERLLKL